MTEHQWLPQKLIQGKMNSEEMADYLVGDVKAPTIFVVAYWCPHCRGKLYLDDDFQWEYEIPAEYRGEPAPIRGILP